jgi:hypothetical protein
MLASEGRTVQTITLKWEVGKICDEQVSLGKNNPLKNISSGLKVY